MKTFELQQCALYGLDHSDSLKSDKALKIAILHSIKQHTPYSTEDLKGKKLELLIASNGSYLECRGKEIEEGLLKEIDQIVQELPQKWQPAQADFRKFRYDSPIEDDDGQIRLLPANSWYTVTF